MNNPDIVLVMPGCRASGDLSYVTKPENLDMWPSAVVAKVAMDTLAAIIVRGFKGVMFQAAELADGRMIGNFLFDTCTPEGRVGGNVLRLAREGCLVPDAPALDAITRIYREQNLPLPEKQNPLR